MKKSLFITLLFTIFLNLSFGSFNRGLSLYEDGKYEQAIDAFKRELIKEETGAVRHNLGVTYFQKGNSGEAIWNMERATLLNPEEEAYHYKLDALREQVGLPPIRLDWKERITSILHHDDWMRVFAYFALTTIAAFMFPIAAGWKHNTRVRILMAVCCLGTILSGLAFSHVRTLLDRGVSLSQTPTELHAAPAEAAPQTGLIRTGERALILEEHNDFLFLKTEGGAEGWLPSTYFRKFY